MVHERSSTLPVLVGQLGKEEVQKNRIASREFASSALAANGSRATVPLFGPCPVSPSQVDFRAKKRALDLIAAQSKFICVVE